MHDVAVIRWCDHGETVRGIESSQGCSGCIRGVCGAALACWQPDSERRPAPRRIPPETIGAVIGAALGLAGAAAMAVRLNLF